MMCMVTGCQRPLDREEHYYVVFPKTHDYICLDCLHDPFNVLLYNFLKDMDALSPEDILDAEVQ